MYRFTDSVSRQRTTSIGLLCPAVSESVIIWHLAEGADAKLLSSELLPVLQLVNQCTAPSLGHGHAIDPARCGRISNQIQICPASLEAGNPKQSHHKTEVKKPKGRKLTLKSLSRQAYSGVSLGLENTASTQCTSDRMRQLLPCRLQALLS